MYEYIAYVEVCRGTASPVGSKAQKNKKRTSFSYLVPGTRYEARHKRKQQNRTYTLYLLFLLMLFLALLSTTKKGSTAEVPTQAAIYTCTYHGIVGCHSLLMLFLVLLSVVNSCAVLGMAFFSICLCHIHIYLAPGTLLRKSSKVAVFGGVRTEPYW